MGATYNLFDSHRKLTGNLTDLKVKMTHSLSYSILRNVSLSLEEHGNDSTFIS